MNLFAVPVFADEEQTHRARIFHMVVWMTMLIATGFGAVVMVQQPAMIPRMAFALVFIDTLGVVLLEVSRRGRTRVASLVFVSGIVVFATVMAFIGGGVRAPGVTTYIVMTLTAGLLLGERAGIITALICSGLALGLAVSEELGILPSPVLYDALPLWLLYCLYLGVVVVLMRLATQTVTRALRRTQSELAERRNAEKRWEQAEKELKDNQLLLQTMIENTPGAVAMFDTEMRYIAYSRRWLSDYRLGDRDLKGLSHYAVFPEIDEDWKDVHRRCLAGATAKRDEDPFPRGDGTEDVVRWLVQPWRKSSGEIGGLTMFTEVITERVRAREERRALRAQLWQSQKLEALGTLAGGIAHDFNNLLAMIGTNAESGQATLPEDHPARKSFNEIVRATERAKDIVKQILLFGRRHEAERKTIPLLRMR